MFKKVVYTSILGNYDTLRQPLVVNDDVDYICFTDSSTKEKIGVWQIRQVPDELKYLPIVKQQRILKICPHRYLKEYDISIWIDGNFQIICDIDKFIDQYDLDKNPIYTRIHLIRKCIYKEADACISFGKDSRQTIQKQIQRYRDEGYPENIGMVETGIMLRKHNDPKCQLICNMWASEVLKGSHRDQLSFNYVCWKNHYVVGNMKNEFKLSSNGTFKYYGHR